MLNLRIRQAQCALADGRLDEAYELARLDEVVQHRRGQQLITQLIQRLIERARAHSEVGRFEQALIDCDRAARLGGNQTAINDLRSAAINGIMAKRHQQRSRQQQIAQARDHLQHGQFTLAQHQLDRIDSSSASLAELAHDAAHQRTTAQAAIKRIESAMSRGDWAEAVTAFEYAKQGKIAGEAFERLTSQLAQRMTALLGDAFNEGRLDRASMWLSRVGALGWRAPAIEEWREIVEQCRQAGRDVEQGDFATARRRLQQVSQRAPKAPWLGQALEQVGQAVLCRDQVQAGPLALAPTLSLIEPSSPPRSAEPLTPSRAKPFRATAMNLTKPPDHSPQRFVLQVDGAGGFLVATQPIITLGPISSSRLPDVGLLAQTDTPSVLIERIEDDYFFRGDGHVQVNGKSTADKLLADDDQLALGPRCVIKYRRPHAASTSAMLELTGARLPRADIRRVILLDDSLVIGPGRHTHIRIDALTTPIVLHFRDGQLQYRTSRQGPATVITMDQPLRLEGVGVVMTKL